MLTRINGRISGDRGFTLIELIVVVIVVAVLAAIAIPLYIGYVKSARVSEATARLGSIMKAAKNYYQRFDAWPTAKNVEGFYGDFSETNHFSYDLGEGEGFVIIAVGKLLHDMDDVTVTMSCADPRAQAEIVITGI
jgi:prepilin-type N-terminal cleavage/methylation domain-containing protein